MMPKGYQLRTSRTLEYIRPLTRGGHPQLAYRPNWQTGCWEWLTGKDGNGYGVRRWKGRRLMAHRVMYEELVGSIPEGLQLDHLCRNTSCVNPLHLEPVTNQENTKRGLAPSLGFSSNRSKTTGEQRDAACRAVMAGATLYSEAKKLGVKCPAVINWLQKRCYAYRPLPRYKNKRLDVPTDHQEGL